MKLIISRHYEEVGFHESDLDYKKEIKFLKNDIVYLALRNANSSYNEYMIVELIEDNSNQIIKCITSIQNFENWDKTIFNIGIFFMNRFSKSPQLMTANETTIFKLEQFMNEKLRKKHNDNRFEKLGSFECSKFSLTICIDENLPNDYISIIFDEQAEFIST